MRITVPDTQEILERYKELAEAGFDGVIISCELTAVHASPGMVRLLGFASEEEVLAAPSDAHVLPTSWERIQEMVAARMTSPYEITLITVTGEHIPAEVTAIHTTWQGRPARLTGVRDLRPRLAMEAAARRSEESFQALVEQLPVAIADTDLEGRVHFTNSAGLRLYGYSRLEEIIGLRVIDFIVPEEREAAAGSIRRRLGGEVVEPKIWTMMRSDGTTFSCMVHVQMSFADGKPVGLKGIMMDVTGQIEAEKRANVAEQKMIYAQKLESLGVLAGGIAHDFNNLLVAIRGHAELAVGSTEKSHPARRHLERIEMAAQRASELTREMLAYAGRTRRVVERVSLVEIVAELSELVSVSIGKTTDLEVDMARDVPDIEADATQIRQIVLNLVTNAAESFGETSGQIRLRGRFKNGMVVLEVEDTGPGIPTDLQSRIFEPFFTTKFEGRGLGLAAVHGIVQSHGGTIDLRSAPGQGTTFTIQLPPAPPEARVAPSRVPSAPPPRGGTVLVIDDELDVREVAREILERNGYEVLVAYDGARGVEVVRERADLVAVVLDQMMPVMGGKEVFDFIRSLRPELPVVLFSGFGEPTFQPEGPYQWLQKPFTIKSLVAAIERARDG